MNHLSNLQFILLSKMMIYSSVLCILISPFSLDEIRLNNVCPYLDMDFHSLNKKYLLIN